MTKLYSYVITHDAGFAPNPFGGLCTLATCKPQIRLFATRRDWIVGTGSTGAVGKNRIVYAARVDEVVPIEQYGVDRRFEVKRPFATGEPWRRNGDNIYFRGSSGEWIQRRNIHHFPNHMQHDLSGKNVLVAQTFWYFGKNAPLLPKELHCIVKSGPFHRTVESGETIGQFEAWLGQHDQGVQGDPFLVK